MNGAKRYGCRSILSALCLQFQLAGHGLRCSLRRTEKGQWVVEAKVRDYTRAVPVKGTMTAAAKPELIKHHGPWNECACTLCRQAGALEAMRPPVSLCDCRQGRDPCSGCAKGVAQSVALHGGC